jgi:putative hemin transport protein
MQLIQSLSQRWSELRATQPHLRIRNAAAQLGVSEAELLATQTGDTVTRLRPEFTAILSAVESLGKVMALTRNEEVVHERKGVYLNPSFDNPHVGLFVGEDIDLRIFFRPWAFAFAVTETVQDKPRHSLQFFANDGEAIHKIYLTPASNEAAFTELVARFRDEAASAEIMVQPSPAAEVEKPDSEINVEAFRKGWVELKDTHDFFGLVRQHGLTRTQALRLAPEGNYATPVQPVAVRKTLEAASASGTPIMAFVGNKGMIQIHTGPVKHLLDRDGWFNVMDPDFNLHIKEAGITQCWVVRKPTTDGVVTALECFNAAGEQVLQLFGKRKPGIPELATWQELIEEVETAWAK